MDDDRGTGRSDAAALQAVPDLGGIPVDDVDERPTGTLHGSLVEAATGLIRYFDVDLLGDRRHILVPVGHTRVARALDGLHVRLRAATRDDLWEIPPYDPQARPADAPYMTELLAAHGRFFHGERYYAHPAYDHTGLYAGDQPVAPRAPLAEQPAAVAPLSALPDYRIAGDEEDIRSWFVVDAAGHPAGVVGELWVDPRARKVRYVGVRAEDGANEVLLPVGYVRIEEGAGRVQVPALYAEEIRSLPAPRGRRLTREDEQRLREALDARLDGRRYYDRPDFTPPVIPPE